MHASISYIYQIKASYTYGQCWWYFHFTVHVYVYRLIPRESGSLLGVGNIEAESELRI